MATPAPIQYEYSPELQIGSVVIANLFWQHIGGLTRRHEGAENNQYRTALRHFQSCDASSSFSVYASAWEKQPEVMKVEIRPPAYPDASWTFELAFERNSFSARLVSPAKAEFIPEGIESMLSEIIPLVFKKKNTG